MKCFTKYMLPLVIAVCMFLGSYFFHLEVEAAEDDQDYPLMSVFPADVEDGAHYVYFHSNGGSTCYFYFCNFVTDPENGDFYYNVSAEGRPYVFVPCNSVRYSYNANTDSWRLDSGVPYGVSIYLNSYSVYSANFDILNSSTGEIFFRAPSPFQRVVQAQDWTTVMTEIVMILPLLIVFLTSLLGLRKGLRFFLNLLHRA
ncbi:MAG: hypothetical protein NC305_12795 [Lachnospiraceae bacterium]|nr:hypothetical protein [Lachnospiraceae bacterium]